MHGSPDDLRLERQAVAVAADELHDRLGAAAHQADGDGQGRRVRVRGGVVGGVDRIQERRHRRELALDLRQPAAVDHGHLSRDHRQAGGQLLLKPRHATRAACAGRVR
jgi:hypothetical protein